MVFYHILEIVLVLYKILFPIIFIMILYKLLACGQELNESFSKFEHLEMSLNAFYTFTLAEKLDATFNLCAFSVLDIESNFTVEDFKKF